MSTAAARVGAASGSVRALDPAPSLGFSGAAVLDDKGRLVGMAVIKPTVVAGPDVSPQARFVSAEEIRPLLNSRNVAPNGAAQGPDGAKASVVRVICVRK